MGDPFVITLPQVGHVDTNRDVVLYGSPTIGLLSDQIDLCYFCQLDVLVNDCRHDVVIGQV